MKLKDDEFIQLLNLFNSLGIIEKGIEKIYHNLLLNTKIDNLKQICDDNNLSLKRGYKICSVLNDLSLVQIYDRPMKINLATPLIEIWQKIVHDRIETLRGKFQEERKKCTNDLEEFIKRYNLKSLEAPQEPVELIIFDINNLDEIYHQFLSKKECKMAVGIRYANPLISFIKKKSTSEIQESINKSVIPGIKKIKDNLEEITIQAIFNHELVREMIISKEFTILKEQIKSINFKFKSINVRITEEDFSNFSLTDTELIQPSFDPNNRLMGVYISRNNNIYQIFYDKFNEIFEKGIPLNQYISNHAENLSIDSLNEREIFLLCLI